MGLSSEAKVGLITLLALIFLGWIILEWGHIKKENNVYYLKILYPDVAGLEPGAPVRLGGVTVGKVSAIEPPMDGKVVVTLAIRRGIVIKDDATFAIGTTLMGDRWVEISINKHQGKPLEEWATAEGKTPITWDTLLTDAEKTLKEFHQTLADMNATVTNKKTLQALHDSIINFNESMKNVKDASVVIKKEVAHNFPSILRKVNVLVADLHHDLSRIGEQVYGFSSTLNRMGVENEKDVRAVVRNLKESSLVLRSALESIRDLVGDKEIHSDVKETIKNVRRSSEKLESIAKQVNDFVSDEDLKEDIRGTIRNARLLTGAANELLGVSEPPTDAGQKSEKPAPQKQGEAPTQPPSPGPPPTLPPEGGGRREEKVVPKAPEKPQAQSKESAAQKRRMGKLTAWDAQFEWNKDRAGVLSSFNFYVLPYRPRSYVMGLRDIGGENTLNLQVRSRWSDNMFSRVGILESQFGVGLDYSFSDLIGTSMDLYDTHHLKGNVHAYIKAYREWEIKLGLRDVFQERRPVIGVRRRF
ncbi:MAG: MCE family protein [Armatimonadetes bacterium]|nr:MCE family protein [Armatimonadota bacterium]